MKAALLLLLALCPPAYAVLPAPGEPGAPKDRRYCGEPARWANGVIKRSEAAKQKFAEVFPCPPTQVPLPSCTGWQIDHVIPRASGGCDSQENMQWLPLGIKTCAHPACKDRWERTYHAIPRQAVKGL